MSPSPVVTYRDGYLEENYLQDEYLDGAVDYAYGFQAQMVIREQTAKGMQANMILAGETDPYGFQALMIAHDQAPYGFQVEAESDAEKVLGFQVEAMIAALEATGMSAKADTLRHAICEAYLMDPYLEDPYLVTCMNAFLGMQAHMAISEETPKGMQAQQVIETQKNIRMQALMIVKKEVPYGFQVQAIQVARYGLQATMVIYNNTQLRLMCDFPSRGTPALGGNNWTASNQAAGDFLPKNLNTDVEEQVFRSALTSVDLICDTGVTQGVTIDTIAILNHNLTGEALVQVQGSNSPTFATINVTFNMTTEEGRMYYIAPTFPTGVLNQNRYWRFVINDATNPDGYVQIGIIVFGNSDIFSVKETWDNPIQKGFKHFKDELKTEGFTAVSNDRALRRWLKLRFTEIERISGNFKIIEDYSVYARTSLKCLVIPAPLYASRYAVFSKLVAMPEFSIRNVAAVDDPDGMAEYVDFNLDWDESL